MADTEHKPAAPQSDVAPSAAPAVAPVAAPPAAPLAAPAPAPAPGAGPPAAPVGLPPPAAKGKHQFTAAERYAVWLAFGGQCYWCGAPLELWATTVDHVLPESLEDDCERLTKLLTYLGLTNFGLNTFKNWVPAHGRCNGRKNALLLPEAPVTTVTLQGIEKRAADAEHRWKKFVADNNRDKLLGR